MTFYLFGRIEKVKYLSATINLAPVALGGDTYIGSFPDAKGVGF